MGGGWERDVGAVAEGRGQTSGGSERKSKGL